MSNVDPRTLSASPSIGENCFSSAVTATVTAADNAHAYENVNEAISMVRMADKDVTGAAFSPPELNALSNELDANGRPLFEDLGWGAEVEEIKGLPVASSSTLSYGESIDAIVGDFRTASAGALRKTYRLR